jgi:hypothetical protein
MVQRVNSIVLVSIDIGPVVRQNIMMVGVCGEGLNRRKGCLLHSR